MYRFSDYQFPGLCFGWSLGLRVEVCEGEGVRKRAGKLRKCGVPKTYLLCSLLQKPGPASPQSENSAYAEAADPLSFLYERVDVGCGPKSPELRLQKLGLALVLH